MPDGVTFIDKDRILRTEFRTRWWEDPHKMTYNTISIHAVKGMPNTPFIVEDDSHYKEEEKPVFFGHYWMEQKAGTRPHIQRDNVCCVDFSVAKGEKVIKN